MNEKLRNAKSASLFSDITPGDRLEARIKGEIAYALQKYRLDNNYTQMKFAEQLNVSQSMLSRWENAEENLTIKTIAKILGVLGVGITVKVNPDKVAVG
jgi:DNA-binding transcriptional regulator YiaG